MNPTPYPRPENLDHLVRILSSFTNYEKNRDFHKGRIRFNLDQMSRLCRAAGDPHLEVPCIHVTGSKGKGSTTLMIDAILRAQGLRTGAFTSPHLERINERIALDGLPLSDRDFVEGGEAVLALLRKDESLAPTFFEFITLMAMMVFRARSVEVALFEVGLGGRLDCTNVVCPQVSVITTVEKEHCAVLGNTLEEIAQEKAGIIKEGVPVVTALDEHHPARPVIREKAEGLHAPLLAPGQGMELTVRDGEHTLVLEGREHCPFTPPLPRSLQAGNAACALTAARTFARSRRLPWDWDKALEAVGRARLPGRFEILDRRPFLIVDGAHTPRSIQAALEEASALSPAGKVHLILALAEDKDAQGIIEAAQPLSSTLFFTTYSGGRALSPQSLQALAQGRGRPTDSPSQALSLAREAAEPEDLILVTGSFYLAGEVRKSVLS